MTRHRRHGVEVQHVPAETPGVPARWEAPGTIEILSQPPEESIEIPTIADAIAGEQNAEAEAGAAETPPAIGEAQADAEADLIADRGIFHPGGHRIARRGGH
jgi:hypothetical protein